MLSCLLHRSKLTYTRSSVRKLETQGTPATGVTHTTPAPAHLTGSCGEFQDRTDITPKLSKLCVCVPHIPASLKCVCASHSRQFEMFQTGLYNLEPNERLLYLAGAFISSCLGLKLPFYQLTSSEGS